MDYIQTSFRIGAEYRECFITTNQTISDMEIEVVADTFAKVIMAQESGEDIEYIRRAVRLGKEEADYLNKQGVGSGILKISGKSPVICFFPLARIERQRTDEEVFREAERFLQAFKVVPRVNLLHRKYSSGSPEGAQTRREPSERKIQPGARPNRLVWAYVMTVYENPYLNTTEVNRKMNLTPYTGARVKKEAVDLGFLTEHRVNFGGPGRSGIYLEVTKLGCDFIGMGRRELPGKGGFPHKVIQYKVYSRLKRLGESVQIEQYLGGKSADVGWTKLVTGGMERIAIEVEPSVHSHIPDEIRKDFDAGWNRVIILCQNRDAMDRINFQVNQHVPAALLDGVDLDLIANYVD